MAWIANLAKSRPGAGCRLVAARRSGEDAGVRGDGEAMDASSCWVIAEDLAGTVNQALGLAEALALPFERKRIAIRAPWRWLPGRLWSRPLARLARGSDPIAPRWPDLVLSCGRKAAPIAAAVRAASGGRSFAVHILDPRLALARFDLVVAPRHDGLGGANVIATRGALNRVTAARLAEAAARFAPQLADLPRPLVAVLVGGVNKAYRFSGADAARLGEALAGLCRDQGAGLAVTFSRRTGVEAKTVLGAALASLPATVWDGGGDNPYFGYLGLADAVVVTGDSVSMASEACTAGKAVYLFEPAGGSAKFRHFHRDLMEGGYVRPFPGPFDPSWTPPRLSESARVAAEIGRRLAERRPARAGATTSRGQAR